MVETKKRCLRKHIFYTFQHPPFFAVTTHIWVETYQKALINTYINLTYSCKIIEIIGALAYFRVDMSLTDLRCK